MKKLNLPLIAILTVGSLVSLVGIKILHDFQVSRNAEALLERAEKAEAEGDAEEQIKLLSRYMQHRREDVDVLKHLLEVTQDYAWSSEGSLQEISRLLGALDKAVRDYPDDPDLRRQGYKVFLKTGRIPDAMGSLEALRDMGELTPEDEIYMANALYVTNDQQQAMELLGQIIGFDMETKTFTEDGGRAPSEVNAYKSLATMYAREFVTGDDYSVPEQILTKGIERNPEDVDAYIARAAFYQQYFEGQDGKERSLEDIRKAIALAPDEVRVILAAAITASALRDFQWAETILTDGLKKHPEDAQLYARMADLQQQQSRTDAAMKFVEQGLEKVPLDTELLYRRANFAVDLANLDLARSTLDQLQRRGLDASRVQLINARIMMAEDKYIEAKELLEKLYRFVPPNSPIQNITREQLATCYRQLGMLDKLPELYGEESENALARFSRAEAFAKQGRLDEAISLLEELVRDQSDLKPEGKRLVHQQLIALRIRRERLQPASQQNWAPIDKMIEAYADATNMSPPERTLMQIELLVQKGQTDEARRATETAWRLYPRLIRFPLLLSSLTPDTEQATNILQRTEQQIGDTVELRAAKANLAIRSGDANLEAKLQALEQGIERFPENEQVQLLQVLASSYRRANLPARALETWKKLLPRDPNNIGLRLTMFDLAKASNDLDAMNEIIGGIEELVGRDSPEWQVCEANRQLWLVQQGQRDAADLQDVMALLRDARNNRSNFAPIYAVQAELQLVQDQVGAAVDSYRTALEKRPGEVIYLQRLAAILMENGRESEAKQYLDQLPADQMRIDDVVSEVRLLLADNPAEALKRANEVLEQHSDDQSVILFVVDVYQAVGKTQESVRLIQQAMRLDPTAPRPWLYLVRTLVAVGQKEKAIEAIKQAESKVPKDELPLLLGQCYATAGELESAQKSIDAGLASKPDDTVLLRNKALLEFGTQQMDEFFQTLDRIISVQGKTDTETLKNVRWARRTKAQQMAKSGTYQDFIGALNLIEENADPSGELAGEDLAVWLRLCAERPETDSRDRAVKRLDEIRRERHLTSAENAVLAYINYQAGRWDEARSLMLDILAKNPGNVEFTKTYIEWLLEAEEYGDAQVYINKLNPNSIEAIRFSSILLAQQGRASDAANRLMAKVPTPLSQLAAAQIMEELGKFDARFYKAAKQLWKKHVDQNPTQLNTYVEFLTRMPKGEGLGEALSLLSKPLKQAIENKNSPAIQYYLGVALDALRSHKESLSSDPKYFDVVLKWIDAAANAMPDDPLMQWQYFDYYDIRSDYTKLEELYLAYLQRSDTTELQRAVVRNNLAFIYAISNQGSKALEVIGDAITQLGPRSDFLDTRGLAYLASRKTDLALKDLRDAVAGGQGGAATYFHLALAEEGSGNVTEAVEAIKRAQAMGLTEADLSGPEVTLYGKLLDRLGPDLPSEGT